MEGLQKRIAPHLLRRVKEDVAKDIPPKEETIIDVELTTMQKQYYRYVTLQYIAVWYSSNEECVVMKYTVLFYLTPCFVFALPIFHPCPNFVHSYLIILKLVFLFLIFTLLFLTPSLLLSSLTHSTSPSLHHTLTHSLHP